MDKELVSSFEAALKRFSAYEKSKPLPSGYAFIPTVNRALRGNREWYKNTWNKYAPGPFDVESVGSWFGDLKGRRIPWVQTKGKSSGFPLVVRGFDSDQAVAANKWAQRSMQWRYSFDDVRKQNEVRLAATSSTAIVPYDVGYAAKQSAKYGFVGPMPDESFYGPTRKGATGFEAHATKARLDKIKESFDFAMLDSDEQFIRGAMHDKGWSRDQAEQVYFKNLTENTKWLRFIAKDNPKIAKNLIPIAKAVGKAGGLPFIGGLATNPALAAVGAAMFVSSEYSKAIKENLNWVNLISAGGGISGDALSAAAGGGLDYASALKLVQGSKRTAAKWKFGEGLDGIFRSTMYGADVSVFNPFATGEDRLRMIYNATKNIKDDGDRLAALEMWGASAEEYNQGRRLETPREQWSIEERISDRARQWKDWREWAKVHGTTWDKINAYTSPDWWIDFWSAREEIGEDRRKEFMSNLPLANTWDEVHDTAEIDDRYRAGMYDNSVTNNDASRNVSLQVNVASPQITTTGDPVDFAKSISIIGSRALSEYQSVIENTDTKRTN